MVERGPIWRRRRHFHSRGHIITSLIQGGNSLLPLRERNPHGHNTFCLFCYHELLSILLYLLPHSFYERGIFTNSKFLLPYDHSTLPFREMLMLDLCTANWSLAANSTGNMCFVGLRGKLLLIKLTHKWSRLWPEQLTSRVRNLPSHLLIKGEINLNGSPRLHNISILKQLNAFFHLLGCWGL